VVAKKVQQVEFSSVLFDTLFGLVLFFSLDSFRDIHSPIHFVFYLFSLIVVIHWWLIFKTSDDAFGTEVTDSGLDLVIGIVELILIEYIVLMARSFDYLMTGWFLVALLMVDLIWTLIWRYLGRWKTTNSQVIKRMEQELVGNQRVVSVGLAMFGLLMAISQFVAPAVYVMGFVILYLVFVVLTFRHKIIDIKVF